MGGLILAMAGLLIQQQWRPLGRGSLVVLSAPPGGSIWLDLKPTNRVTDGRLDRVRPGRHSVTVHATGMQPDPVAQVVDVRAGHTDTVRFRLFRQGTTLIPSATGSTQTDLGLPLSTFNDSDDLDSSSLSAPTGDQLRRSAEYGDSVIGRRQPLLPIHKEPAPLQTPLEARPRSADGKGGVDVSTSEPGARIYVDEIEQAGTSPLRLSLEAGTHVIRVEREGYEADPTLDTVIVRAGSASQSIFFNLSPKNQTVWQLVIDTKPIAGSIFVDDQSVGRGRAVVNRDPGLYAISFGPVTGWITPQPVRVSITPTQPQPSVSGVYVPAVHILAEVADKEQILKEGSIRWSVGIYSTMDGAEPSTVLGAKVREIPNSRKLGWELGIGDLNRNPTGGDYIAFTFELPSEVDPASSLNLRLYLYRSDKRYPLVFTGGRSEIVVQLNDRTFLDNYRPTYTTIDAEAGRYEEWSLQGMLVPGENRLLIRAGERNTVFNYLWKLEVL